jgi:hypothetical protein
MLFLYFRDSLRRIELPTVVKVAVDQGDPSLAAFLDAANTVVARVRDEDIAAFARVDLGPILQIAGSAGSVSSQPEGQESFEHQQAPEFTDSPEAGIPE